jgi:hypothetical protein
MVHLGKSMYGEQREMLIHSASSDTVFKTTLGHHLTFSQPLKKSNRTSTFWKIPTQSRLGMALIMESNMTEACTIRAASTEFWNMGPLSVGNVTRSKNCLSTAVGDKRFCTHSTGQYNLLSPSYTFMQILRTLSWSSSIVFGVVMM